MNNNTLYWLWLTAMPGITNDDIQTLRENFDTVNEIYNAADFDGIYGLKPNVKRGLRNKSMKRAEHILEYAEKCDIKLLSYDDINYPDMLRNITNPPFMLYLKGNILNWDRLLSIGVVGTRKCSDYGIAATKKICTEIAEKGVTVVSGLAEGIDAAAANAAINAGSISIGVLGCGIDRVYPAKNWETYNRVAKNGAIITEFPPGTPPLKHNFPWRNRIISGISKGVLVVEAPKKSGALITAEYAVEQGKDVYSVPGSIFRQESEGTNGLLSGYAKAVTCGKDIIDEYPYEAARLKTSPKGILSRLTEKKNEVNTEIKFNVNDKKYQSLSDDEKVVVGLLIEHNLHIDEIKRLSGFNISKLTPMLSILEFGGYIQKMPGNNYRLNI